MLSTGRLNEEAVRRALQALARPDPATVASLVHLGNRLAAAAASAGYRANAVVAAAGTPTPPGEAPAGPPDGSRRGI